MEADGIRRDGYNASELCYPSAYIRTPYYYNNNITVSVNIRSSYTRVTTLARRRVIFFFFPPDGAILNIAYTATSSEIDEEKLQLLNAFILYYYFIVCHDGV